MNKKYISAGFTLVELMVAMAGFALVSLAAFSVLQSGQRTQIVNDQVVKVQQSARLALDLISRDIRMAGYGYGGFSGFPLPGGCGGPIVTRENQGPASDQISIISIGQVIGTLTAVTPPAPNVTITLNNNPVGAVAVGNVVSIDGVFTANVTAVNAAGPNTLNLSQSASSAINAQHIFQPGATVVQVACITYSVSGPAPPAPGLPYQLLRTVGTFGVAPAVPIVDGIESIQFAYALDANNDGIIDDQANSILVPGFDCLDFVPNTPAPPPFPPGPAVQMPCPPPIAGTVGALSPVFATINGNPTSAKQVRITVVARAIPPSAAYFTGNCWRDPSFTGTSAMIVENQVLLEPVPAVGCPALAPGQPSGIRRRALTRVVSLRDTNN